MADVIKTDPKAMADLLAQVEAIKSHYLALAQKAQNRPTRGKYEKAMNELKNSDLPIIELSNVTFPNESEASMRQSFKKVAEKLNMNATVVFDGDAKYLIDFDAHNAAESFDKFIMKKAGISKSDLAAITAELDNATK